MNRSLQVFEVQAEVRLNLVVPTYMFLYGFELGLLVVVDTLEPVQLSVCLRMANTA